MKNYTSQFLVAVLLLMSVPFMSFSKNTRDPLVKYLESVLAVPTTLLKENESKSVLVEVTVDTSGKITVVQTNAEDTNISMYVIHKLEKMKVNTSLIEPGKSYCFKIVFRR